MYWDTIGLRVYKNMCTSEIFIASYKNKIKIEDKKYYYKVILK